MPHQLAQALRTLCFKQVALTRAEDDPGGRVSWAGNLGGARRQQGRKTTAGSFGETRAQAERSRLKGGCSQDWLPHKASRQKPYLVMCPF
jgi:hypothetical protein